MPEKFKLYFALTLVLYLIASTFCSAIYYLQGIDQVNSHTILFSSLTVGINFFITIVCLSWDGFIEAYKKRQFNAILCTFIFSAFCGGMLFESLKMLSFLNTDFWSLLETMGLSGTTVILMLFILNCINPK